MVAPGYFECQGEVLDNVVPAGMQGNPVAVPLYRTCGFKHQDGSGPRGTEQCSCGMYSVGACTRCGDPLCGNHLAYYGGKLLCPRHAAELERASAARAEEQRIQARLQEEQRLARERAVDVEVDDSLPELAPPANPPHLAHNSEPDPFWFLGTFLYWLAGTLVIGLIAHSIATGALVAGVVAVGVLGFWLLRAAANKATYHAADLAHKQSVAAMKERQRERAELRASLMATDD
jgi:uncharacterized Zn finger protein (UPF0148 family)